MDGLVLAGKKGRIPATDHVIEAGQGAKTLSALAPAMALFRG
jgi:hypothetical protein